MNTGFRHETAKIYQFPRKTPVTHGADREENKSATDHRGQRLADAAFGGSWYHEAAVQDADRTRKP